MNRSDNAALTFEWLIESLRDVHAKLQAQAGRAVNVSLTIRNWLIGAYIAEYELRGADRAAYGENLLSLLAQRLTALKVSNCNRRQLYDYVKFYRVYPTIVRTVSAQCKALLPSKIAARCKKVPRASALLGMSTEDLVRALSYSHFKLLVDTGDDLKRTFYEMECGRGNWSVRELSRQIGSLYYERSGLSRNKRKLSQLVQAKAETAEPKLAIRDPYVFEFLGLNPKEIMSESNVEDQLLARIQDFLLELGHGFCFEARQKRILIGDTHGFVDLVFYHRILKCHVLVELKIEKFTHENLGQLNTYVSWYRRHMMAKGDNPPIGILLCAQRDHSLVEYALAGLDNRLFVSKYQLELPKRREMQRFIEEQIRETTQIASNQQRRKAKRTRR